ncbi:TonB-dependent siderophore receptor [Luteolibacter sp. GHJ8]|uniref:TonB-dependent siderophore receptor n=1 Tax=Luteolibacter rhizosphaerae TaxID=2989719 RepID=A0ABT3G9S1_9BACT|nr:TonB-dependent siderophore receptor [Luteolibacter rhizosphaerae]MCW1915950.1 TonB-dependent siderophore receptor [Luteolibacter rhizosphaerae]
MPLRDPLPLIPSILAASFITAPLLAQSTEPDALKEIVVKARDDRGAVAQIAEAPTKTDTPLIETPQSVSVVSRAEIERRGAQSVAEALGYTPGVVIGVGGEDSRFDDILIRGYDAGSTSTNMYRDGLRVPAGGQWTRTQFDIFGLESIEVLKGPSAVLFGQVAPGGLVNMTSKRPTAEHRGMVSTQYGSFDTWQAAADISGPIDGDGQFLYRIAGLYRDGGSQIDHTDLERKFIAPSFTWNISEDTSLTVLAAYQEDRGGSTFQFLPVAGTLYPAPLGYIRRENFLGEPTHNTYERDQWSLGYELKHRFNEHLSFVQNARFSDNSTFYEGVVGGTRGAALLPNAAGVWTRRAVRGIGDAHNFTIDSRLQADFSTGPIEHTLIGGFDYLRTGWTHLRTGRTTTPINIFLPIYTGVTGPFTAQVGQDTVESQHGIYIQDQLKWGGWHLTLGGRRDSSDIELHNTLTNAVSRTSSHADTGRAGLLYLFDNGIAPYASYATSFEPVAGTDANDVPFDPSEGEQVEIGVKYQPKNFNALFTASAFQLNQENVLTLDPNDPLFQTQTGEIELRGIELEAKVALTEGLAVTGGWTFMESEILRNNDGNQGNDFMNVPSNTGSMWVDYTFQGGPLEGLGIGTGVRYVGDRFGDNANTYRIPSYTLIDAGIRYDLGKLSGALEGARIALTGTNLADKVYVAKAETNISANYGPGRALNLNLSYHW